MKKNPDHFLKQLISLFVIAICLGSFEAKAQNLDFDRNLGKQGAQEVIEQIGIYEHETASSYVTEIGDRLIRELDSPLFDYTFNLIDMSEPNAFALPGGYIYISRGLLCAANTEDELAGVIGHEIIHSQMRHSVQQMRKSIFPALLQLPGAIVGVVVNEDLGNLINIPLSAGGELLLSKYSRNHEKEADRLGVKVVADAGYDPGQLAVILENMSREVEVITGKEEKFSYLKSHPFTPSRVKYLSKETELLNTDIKESIANTREDFLKKIEGTYFWDNPEAGFFRGDTFLHPDLGLYFIIPKGWSTFNTPAFVGAVDEENNRGMIYLRLADTNSTPEYLGIKFAKKLKEEHNTIPERSEKVSLNGLDAFLVSVKDTTGPEPVGIHNLWFKLNENTFQVLGASYETEYALLEKSANSLRILNEEDNKLLTVQVLRYASAIDGESIEDFNKRTGNTWNVELTAVMNNIQVDEQLKEGQFLKIAKMEKYN
jgi:predicted Zn-dependent protease